MQLRASRTNGFQRMPRRRLLAAACLAAVAPAFAQEPLYQRRPASPDGIGKLYMGREISHVMGWQGAPWLEREEREREERTDLLVPLLALKLGMAVADVGAGSGYFARRIAGAVGSAGTVYAVDVQPEMVRMLEALAAKTGLGNIRPVLGAAADVKLAPASIDLALMVDVYHELSRPAVTVDALRQSLRRGQEGVRPGRLALVEYRGEDPSVPIKPLHRTTVQQLKAELEPRGFRLVEKHEFLPHQHVLVFERRELLANASQ